MINLFHKIITLFRPAVESKASVRLMFSTMLGLVAFMAASLVTSDGSYIKLVANSDLVLKGERFSIEIYAYATEPVNALDLTINYDKSVMKVISVDKAQSVLTIWTEEPKITDTQITLGGGTFRRGFVGEHLVAVIKAEAMTTGRAEVLVESARLLAGDGLGTPVKLAANTANDKVSFIVYDTDQSPDQIRAELGLAVTADIDGDGKVTLRDISSFMAAWHNKTATYDFNNDGRMNFVDFSIILAKSFLN
jgi:hypothetical protein